MRIISNIYFQLEIVGNKLHNAEMAMFVPISAPMLNNNDDDGDDIVQMTNKIKSTISNNEDYIDFSVIYY